MVLSHCLNDQSDTPRSRDTSVMEQMKASHCLSEMADALAVSKSGFFAHQRKGNGLEFNGTTN